jgi:hypothetical protein
MKQPYQGVSPGIETVCEAFALQPLLAALQAALSGGNKAAFVVLHCEDARWYSPHTQASGIDPACIDLDADASIAALARCQALQIIAQQYSLDSATARVFAADSGLLLEDRYRLQDGRWCLASRRIQSRDAMGHPTD